MAFALSAPAIAPMAPVRPFSYTPQMPGAFVDKAPAPTPYGAFTAPDPASLASNPEYNWRLSQGLQAVQRGAAAKGTLLTGGAQKALEGYAGGEAGQAYNDLYGHALSTYSANRDTNAQNFNQGLAGFGANLNAYQANNAANSLGLNAATAGYDRNYNAARTGYEDTVGNTIRQTDVSNANAANTYQQQMDDYARAVEGARQGNAAIQAAHEAAAARPSPYALNSRVKMAGGY